MAATAERGRVWRFDGYKEEEGTAVITLTVPRRLAWALGIFARGQRVDPGQLCQPALTSIIKGKRIPWSWFDEILASERPEGPKLAPQEGQGKDVDATLTVGEEVPPPPTLDLTPALGGGEGAVQPPARPAVDHAAARAKLDARRQRKAG